MIFTSAHFISYDFIWQNTTVRIRFPQKNHDPPGTNVTYALENSILKMIFLSVPYRWQVAHPGSGCENLRKGEGAEMGPKTHSGSPRLRPRELWTVKSTYRSYIYIYIFSIYILAGISFIIYHWYYEGYSKRKTDILIYFPKKKSCRFQLQKGCWLKIWLKGSSFSVFQAFWAIEDLTK